MAFVPEDGTGLPNANSLIDVAFADEYASVRGMDAWMAIGPTDKQFLLVRATDHLQKCYTFKGYILSDEQALAFPRGGIYRENAGWELEYPPIPVQVKQAVVEYAVRLATTPLLQDQVPSPEGVITVKSVQVGPIKEQTEYLPGGTPSQKLSVPAADLLLRDFIIPGRTLNRS